MNILRTATAILVALMFTPLLSAQVTLRSTTFSAAVGLTDRRVVVASASGIEVGDIAYADREAMRVTAIDGTALTVTRGIGGVISTHVSGGQVYVDDQLYFTTTPKPLGAPCTATSEIVLPVVNISTGDIYNCLDSLWWLERTDGAFRPKFAVTTDSTAGALTYTGAMLKGGLILRDPNGAGRSDVTPTAALLMASIPGVRVGDSFEFTIRNTADAAETITVTAGTGATISGTATIAQNNSKRFRVTIDSLSAYTVYSLGTVVH